MLSSELEVGRAGEYKESGQWISLPIQQVPTDIQVGLHSCGVWHTMRPQRMLVATVNVYTL